MNFDEWQKAFASACGFSAQDLDLIKSQIPAPKYLDFICNRVDHLPQINNFFISSYNNIKDESWPVCHNRNDLKNLPLHIIEECKNVHKFDFLIYDQETITREQWNSFESGAYPVSELIRYDAVVLKLKKYLTNKKVIDFACHAGMISLLCLHAGAKSVTATNVRPEFVKLANEVMSLSDYSQQFNALVADIHDYENNTALCQGADTVLLYGIMYHVHDHCQIIDSILKSKPKTLIIDTWVLDNIINSDEPLMTWRLDHSDDCWQGWHDGQKLIAVGTPNTAWFKLYLENKNYCMTHEQKYFSQMTGSFDLPQHKRSVMVFEPIVVA
jgi:2-polyprenyl-3-methyl-5-hydroxy-6-metoxy-1,4-benzoquinol methylase